MRAKRFFSKQVRREQSRYAFLAALLIVALLLTGCAVETEIVVPENTPLPEPEGLRIAVASDLHLNPDNTEKGEEVYAVLYSPELLDALLWDARQQEAEILLLTGDLVNDGKQHRLDLLAEKLHQAEETGMDVYVLPGNHDLGPATQTDFAATLEDFGFAEAFSRDPASLSYCVIRDGLMILMMDTGGYGARCIDLPGAEIPESEDAFFSEKTLSWVERMLKTAGERDLHVLCAGHYNLLTDISRQPESGFFVENGPQFADLLREYRVPLYLSGHMHTRGYYRENGLSELLTEYLLSYPTGYSILDLTESGIGYQPRRVNVDAWAVETGEEDPHLIGFAAWQQQVLYDYSRENVEFMAERNPMSRGRARKATEFFYTVMSDFWDGSLNAKREELKRMPGYEPFFLCAEGFAYGWWLKDLIETAPPELAGFSLPWITKG